MLRIEPVACKDTHALPMIQPHPYLHYMGIEYNDSYQASHPANTSDESYVEQDRRCKPSQSYYYYVPFDRCSTSVVQAFRLGPHNIPP